MDTSSIECGSAHAYELRFAGLFNTGRGYAFPCDSEGNVDTSVLTEHARVNYLRARAAVGRDFFAPVKCTCEPCGSRHA